ncbi:MAG TPA: hypothetical protein VIQ30_25185 [Pseudonocardia sp.]
MTELEATIGDLRIAVTLCPPDEYLEIHPTRVTELLDALEEAQAAVKGLVDNYAAHDQQAFEAAHQAACDVMVKAGGEAP